MIYCIRKWLAVVMALLLCINVIMVPTQAETESEKASIGNVSLNATFVSGGAHQGNDLYVWKAASSASGHAFIFNVNMDVNYITGQNSGKMPVGTIKTVVPLHILKDKNGQYADTLELPFTQIKDTNNDGNITADEIPQDLVDVAKKSSDELSYFAYFVNEKTNQATIMNIIDLEHSINDVFDVKYSATKKTFDYFDYQHDHSSSEAFYAGLSIDGQLVDKSALSDQSAYHEAGQIRFDAKTKSYKVAMDTSAKVTNVYKGEPTLFKSWDAKWGEAPADADQYYYLVWEIRSRIDDPTQSYHFSLTDTLDQDQGTVAGFRLAGNGKYKLISNHTETASITDEDSAGEAKALNGTGYRYDYVLTRHAAAHFTNGYKIKNTITATVEPVDGIDAKSTVSSSRVYSYEVPSYTGETGSAYVEKSGNEHWNSRLGSKKEYYKLEQLQSGDTNTYVEDLKYNIHANALPYQWTLKEGGNPAHHEDYGQKNVTYEITDDTLWLYKKADEQFTSQVYNDNAAKRLEAFKLDAGDYDFASLTYKLDTSMAEWNEETQKFDKVRHTLDDSDAITWYVKVHGSYLKAVTYNFGRQEKTLYDEGGRYISYIDGSQMTFETGVDGIKAEVTNKLYNSTIDINPNIKLFATDHVKSIVNALSETENLVILKNKATFTLHDEEHQKQYFTSSRVDGNLIRSASRASDLKKRLQASSNDVRNKTFTLSWQVSQDEIMNTDGGTAYIPQNGGTFYDLLPEGATLKKDSVIVQSKDDPKQNEGMYTIDEAMYSITSQLNYKGSGRTLITIHVNGSYPCLIVSYSTLHSWEGIRLYGTSIRNPVAYETGNEDIADGFADNGGKLSSANKAFMSDLDKETDAKRFIYSEDATSIEVVTAALAGLDKKVIASDDESWTRNTMVTPNSDYAYRLRYSNVKEEGMKHIILYDRLEKYDKSSSEKSQWRGILQQIDISQITKTYPNAHPVIYLSMKKDIDLKASTSALEPRSSDAQSLDNAQSDTWMTLAQYESQYGKLGSQSNVTPRAIAIKLDDSFSLATNQMITATLYMKAPAHVSQDLSDVYPQSYNDVYMYGERGEETKEASYLNQGYTSVKYHVTSAVTIHKVDAENSEPISGISFRVSGTSAYQKAVDETKQTNAQGNVTFKDLEKGTYTLQEVAGNDDYLEDHTEYQVKIDEESRVKIWKNGESEPDDFLKGSFTIENTPRVHNDITFEKRSLEDQAAINGAYFRLTGTSYYKNDISMTAVSAGGKVTFKNVERGIYKLEEYKAPDDFVKAKNAWSVTIDENGVIAMSGDDLKGENGGYTIYNEPYHTLKIWKQDATNAHSLKDAQFSLKGSAESGRSIDLTALSSTNGFLTFDHLEAGHYLLQETKAPEGYRLDDTVKDVTITRTGEITMDGQKPDSQSEAFIIKNTPIPAGRIVVTKKWVDDGQTKEHPIPKLHLREIKDGQTTSVAVLSSAADTQAKVRSANTFHQASIQNYPTSALMKNLRLAQIAEEGPFTPTSNTSGTVKWTVYRSGTDYILEFSPTSGDHGRFANDVNAAGAWRSSKLNNQLLSAMITKVRFKGTISATYYRNFFRDCKKIKEIDFTGFDASNVKDFWNMFNNTASLTSVDVSHWDMSNNTDLDEVFRGAAALRKITGLDTWDIAKATKFNRFFENCTLDEVDLSGWNFASFTDLSQLFNKQSLGYPKIKKLIMKNCQLPKVTGLTTAFDHLSGSLEEIDLSGSRADSLTTAADMFNGYTKLKTVNVSSMQTPKLTDMSQMFYNCTGLQEVTLNGMDTSQVTSMSNLFNTCTNLKTVNVNQLDVSHVTNFFAAFFKCTSLTELSLSNWDTSAGTNLQELFSTCSNLEVLKIPKINTRNDANAAKWIFRDDPKLRAVQLGPNFQFRRENSDNNHSNLLPAAGNGDTEKYSGKWSYGSNRQTQGFTPEEVKDIFNNASNENYSSRAGWWYWQLSAKELNKPEEYDSIDDHWIDDHPDQDYAIADSQGNAGYWQKIDDQTWTYTFYVYNQNAKWEVSEQETDLISYDTASVTATYIADQGNKSVILESQQKSAVFINTSKALATRTYGSLTLSKQVTKADPQADDPQGDTFTFAVQLTNEQYPNLITGMHEYSATLQNGNKSQKQSVIFQDGHAVIALEKGQSLTIHSLAAGTHYTINEQAEDDYALETIMNGTSKQEKEASGTISDQNDSVVFTNKYLKKAPKTVTITLRKKITGDETQLQSSYPFEILLSGLTPDQTYTFGNDIQVKADDFGKANINDLKLAKDEALVLSNVPVGIQYQIREIGGATYCASYDVTNSSQEAAIASTHGANTEVNKDLSTATETADEGEDITVTFTNALEAAVKTRKLKLVKLVSGADHDQNAYAFTIQLKGLKPDMVIHTSRNTITANSSGEANTSYYLKKDESIILEDVPVKATYVITEAANIMTPSYVITHLDDKRVDVNNADVPAHSQAGKENTALSTGDQTMPDANVNVTFTNSAPATGSLAIKKIVTGNMGNRNKLFRFKINLTQNGKAISGTFPAILMQGDTKIDDTEVQLLKGEAEVYLSHNQTLTVNNIPVHAQYLVQEVDYEEEGYHLVRIDQTRESAPTQVVSTTLGESELTLTASQAQKEGTIPENDVMLYTYTNDRQGAIPTRARMGLSIISLTIGSFLAILYMLDKRKKIHKQ